MDLERVCYELNCALPHLSVEVLTPEPKNLTLFENKVTSDIIS